MKKTMLILVFITISLFGKDYYDKTLDSKKIGWMDKGKEVIKNRLKDVDSAKFRNIYFNRGKLNLPATCGQVNSKNSFGSYTGYKRFIFAGKNFVFIESDVSDFHNLWNKLCE